MNAKQVGLGLAILLIVGGAGYWMVRQASAPATSVLSPLAPTTETLVPTGEVPPHLVSSDLAQLHSAVFGVLRLCPADLSPLFDGLIAFQRRLMSTKMWAQLDLDNVARQLPPVPGGGPAPVPPAFDLAGIQAIEDFFKREWLEIKEILVVVGEASTPGRTALLVDIPLSGTNVSTAARQLASLVLPIDQVAGPGNLGVQLVSGQDHVYTVKLAAPAQGFVVEGRLELAPDRLSLVVGHVDRSAFFAAEPKQQLVRSAPWADAQPAFAPGAGLAYWGRYDQLMDRYVKFLDFMVQSSGAAAVPGSGSVAQLLDMGIYKEMESLAGGIFLGEAPRSVTCARALPGSSVDKIYAQFLDRMQSARTPSIFADLLSERTILGVKITTALLDLLAESVLVAYPQEIIDQVLKDPQFQGIVSDLKNLREFAQESELGEVAIVVDSSPAVMIPEVKIAVTHRQGVGAQVLDKIRAIVEPLVQSGGGTVSAGVNAAGQPNLQLMLAPMVSLVGEQRHENAIVFSSAPAMAPAPTQSLVSKVRVAGEPLDVALSRSESAFFFATKPILDMVLPYSGMVTANMGPDAPSPDAIEEIAKLLDVRLALFQQSRKLSGGRFCSDQFLAVVP